MARVGLREEFGSIDAVDFESCKERLAIGVALAD